MGGRASKDAPSAQPVHHPQSTSPPSTCRSQNDDGVGLALKKATRAPGASPFKAGLHHRSSAEIVKMFVESEIQKMKDPDCYSSYSEEADDDFDVANQEPSNAAVSAPPSEQQEHTHARQGGHAGVNANPQLLPDPDAAFAARLLASAAEQADVGDGSTTSSVGSDCPPQEKIPSRQDRLTHLRNSIQSRKQNLGSVPKQGSTEGHVGLLSGADGSLPASTADIFGPSQTEVKALAVDASACDDGPLVQQVQQVQQAPHASVASEVDNDDAEGAAEAPDKVLYVMTAKGSPGNRAQQAEIFDDHTDV